MNARTRDGSPQPEASVQLIKIRTLPRQLLRLGFAATPALAQSSTDIYVAALSLRDGQVRIDELRNITDRDGYDNQPGFSPDGQSLLFTSIREAGGQADTYRYDFASGSITQVTRTRESEYSPTIMPGRKTMFSVVQVEADSTQRLWHFDLKGRNQGVLLADVQPVGYHAWYDAATVALFVLGSPPTLQIADIRTGQVDVVAEGIGRSLHRIPSRPALSFVHKVSEDEWWIKELNLQTREIVPLVRTLSGSEDFVWTPGGVILMGHDSKLYLWNPEGSGDWELVTDLAGAGVAGITRIAASPDGTRLAIVAEREAAGGGD